MSGYLPDGLTTTERDYIYGDPWEEQEEKEEMDSNSNNGYSIVSMDDVPERRWGNNNRKGSSVWQPVIDRALANPGSAIKITLADHPELARIRRAVRPSHFGGVMRRLGLAGKGHMRITPDAMYIWIDPPELGNA